MGRGYKLTRQWGLLDYRKSSGVEEISGQGKHSWQAGNFLETRNFWTRKPSWQGESFWKELLDKGKTSWQGKTFWKELLDMGKLLN